VGATARSGCGWVRAAMSWPIRGRALPRPSRLTYRGDRPAERAGLDRGIPQVLPVPGGPAACTAESGVLPLRRKHRAALCTTSALICQTGVPALAWQVGRCRRRFPVTAGTPRPCWGGGPPGPGPGPGGRSAGSAILAGDGEQVLPRCRLKVVARDGEPPWPVPWSARGSESVLALQLSKREQRPRLRPP